MNSERLGRALLLAAMPLLLVSSSCAGKAQLKGRYSSHAVRQGIYDIAYNIEFKDRNRANVQPTVDGAKGALVEVGYEVNSREVKLTSPQGTMVGSITDAGCLEFAG